MGDYPNVHVIDILVKFDRTRDQEPYDHVTHLIVEGLRLANDDCRVVHYKLKDARKEVARLEREAERTFERMDVLMKECETRKIG